MKNHALSNSDLSGFKFDNSYIQLAPILYQKQRPSAVKNPSLVLLNHQLAKTLGLNCTALEKEGADFW